MAQAAQSKGPAYKKMRFGNRLARDMRQNWQIYLMWLPVLAFYLIFKYAPMGGLIIAFEKYKPAKGILNSQWVGMKYFVDFLTGPYAWRTIRNTLIISLLQIIVGFPLPILFALLINEVKHSSYKRVVQTVSYMPHFISLVVLCGMTQAQMDDMLNAMRAWRKERLLKAVLTPTNQHWTCPELLREIQQEDEALRHG